MRTRKGNVKTDHRLRFFFALLSAVFVLAGSVFAFAPASANPTAPADSDSDSAKSGLSITLDEVTPWIDDKGTLKVRGLITNSSDEPIKKPSLDLMMSTRNLDAEYRIEAWKTDQTSSRQVASFADNGPAARKKVEDRAKKRAKDNDEDAPKPKPVTEVDSSIDKEIGAGSSHQFSITVPAAKLGLPKSSPVSSWGPRGLAVNIGDSSGPLASEVAFTTWYPQPKFDQTKVSILAPVTIPGYSPNGLISAENLDTAITPGGSLETINEVLDEPNVSIALDPKIIASFETALKPKGPPAGDADDPGAEGEEAPNEAETQAPNQDGGERAEADSPPNTQGEARTERLRTWYKNFLEKAKKHTVIALPYADPDQTALEADGLSSLNTFADKQKELVHQVLPEARTDIAWPVGGATDREQLQDFKKSGTSTVILDDTQQPSITGIRDSAHSKTKTSSSAKSTIQTLIGDTALRDLSSDIIGQKNPAAGVSELVAVSAAIQSEAPYRSRHLLIPLPRAEASANWTRTVDALARSPWMEVESLDTLLKLDASPRGILQPVQDPKHISSTTVSALGDIRRSETEFNTAFTEPGIANTRLDRSLLSCTSAAWTAGGNANDCAVKARTTSMDNRRAISLEEGSSVLLVTGEKTTIPVTIVNNSHTPARVHVRMRPRTPQLKTTNTETVTVPPTETMRVDVPVEGLANADVPTTIEMVTNDDVVLPENTSLMVRVRADWENIGTAVIGLGLAAVFVIGLIKSVSRGRRKIPEQQLAAAMARAKSHDPEKR